MVAKYALKHIGQRTNFFDILTRICKICFAEYSDIVFDRVKGSGWDS